MVNASENISKEDTSTYTRNASQKNRDSKLNKIEINHLRSEIIKSDKQIEYNKNLVDAPQTPDTPQAPEVPQAPDTPQAPEVPQTPDTPRGVSMKR